MRPIPLLTTFWAALTETCCGVVELYAKDADGDRAEVERVELGLVEEEVLDLEDDGATELEAGVDEGALVEAGGGDEAALVEGATGPVKVVPLQTTELGTVTPAVAQSEVAKAMALAWSLALQVWAILQDKVVK